MVKLKKEITQYERKSWPRLAKITNHNIRKILLENNEKIYFTTYKGEMRFEVKTDCCRHCRRELKVGFARDIFVVNQCECIIDEKK